MKKILLALITIAVLLVPITCLAAQETLCISFFVPLTNEQQMQVEKDFAELYPHLTIVWDETRADAKQAMMFRDGTIDVFYESTEYGTVQMLMDKGFCMDLSASPIIADRFAQLAPPFAELLTHDGNICAYPWCVRFDPLARWDDDTAELFELTRPNGIFLLDDALALADSVILPDDDTCAVCYDGTNNPYLHFAFAAYKYGMLSAGEALRYDTPKFRTLLDKLDSYTVSSEIFNTDDTDLDPLYTIEYVPEHVLFSFDRCVSGGEVLKRGDALLPVSLQRGTPPVISAYLECLVINPYSKHPDAALALVEMLMAYQDEADLASMCSSIVSFREPEYDRCMAKYQAAMDELEELLASGRLEMDRELYEDQLKQTKKQMEVMDNYLTVSQEKISHYQQQVLPYLFLRGSSVYEQSNIDQLILDAFDQYAGGMVNRDTFLSKLDSRMMMMAAEAE